MKNKHVYITYSKSFQIVILLLMCTVLLFAGLSNVSHAQELEQDVLSSAKGSGNGQGGGSGGQGGGGEEGGGEEGEEVQGNNLSFPTVTADGYAIVPVATTSFDVAYEGPYTDLSSDQIALLEGRVWYAQKTEGNTWQAEYLSAEVGSPVPVFGVDWGDNLEAVNPVVGNPFRLEVVLYAKPEESMLGYEMALLANPSSPDEVQGTAGDVYQSEFATIVADTPQLLVQNITDVCTTDLAWTGSDWSLDGTSLEEDSVTFGPELNVGGKYIYGASKGGWRPKSAGVYRVTMYFPESDISLSNAIVGNYEDWTASVVPMSTEEGDEGEEVKASVPMVDTANNISFVDLVAVSNSGGGSSDENEVDDYDPCAVVDEPATTTDPVATTTDPEVSDEDTSSDSSGGSSSTRVSRTTAPAPIVLGVSTSKFITQEAIDAQRVLLNKQIQEVQHENLRLLQFMLIDLLEKLLTNLQASE